MEIETNDVFEEWNSYADRKELKPREIDLLGVIKNSKLKVIAITGVRRGGKTSILLLLNKILKKEKGKQAYVNLEDSRIKDDPNILTDIIKWFGDEGTLLLDEVTSVNDWENWLARNHEMLKGSLKIIVSSSRHALIKPVKSLRGRMIPYEIYPLSFREFLQFNEVKIEKTTAGIGELENQLKEYIIYGGFPEVVLLQEKTEKTRLLNTYFRDIIGLDVAEIAKEKISVVELFGKYVLSGSYFSASKCLNFFKTLGHKIAKQSILEIERHSQESYLFFFVPIFSYNLKDKNQYPRKVYAVDSGFMYAISGKAEMGRLFENAVFLELKRRFGLNEEINYWKNKEGLETDFVIRNGLKIKEIIQVVYDLNEKKTKDRETNGLVACAKEFKLKEGLIITRDYEGIENIDDIKVKFIPLWKWLLK